MQGLIQHSRSWTALRGCLHGVRQPTLIGQFVIGPVDPAAVERADGLLLQAFDELNLVVPDAPGAIGVAHRVARLAEAAQCYFGHPVSGDVRFTPMPRTSDETRQAFRAALPYHHARSAGSAIAWAASLINHLVLSDEPDVLGKAKRSLDRLGKQLRPAGLTGINSVHFVRAAYQLGIPVQLYAGDIYRYGTGHFARPLHSTATDRTSTIGVCLARSKFHTAGALRSAGLPASQPRRIGSADDAVLAADRMGYPVVLKPNDQDGGVGVFAGLQTADEVREAYRETAAAAGVVLIEKHFPGNDYRLTVHEDQIVKVEQRAACGIVGDGAATVAELVEAKQASTHLRRILRETGKIPLSLDREAMGLLSAEGLTESSVLEKGRRIALRRKNNISSGGEQLAVKLSDVHPDNAALAVRAARLMFLDIAGVDLIIADIGQSWNVTGALICEVNAQPQVGVRTSPDIYRDILRRLVGEQARVPAHLLVVEETGSSLDGQAASLAAGLGCNGISSSDGMWIDGERVPGKPENAFTSASTVLRDPDCRAALCVIPAAEITSKGLPLDWFDSIFLPRPSLTDQALLGALRPHAGSILDSALHA